ncbi:5-oxoprolinase subunit PxpA [Colwelliaceae bacterium 6471]
MKLNCDLGEGFGCWQKGLDAEIMPFIDYANIACGFHASDPLTMRKTVKLAKANNVGIGAHPGYADLIGFGRRSIAYPADELIAIIQYQIGALQALCENEDTCVSYVKPHGALYNDMMRDLNIFTLVCQAISALKYPLPLMIQALPNTSAFKTIAEQYGVPLWFEAFADRHYQDNGLLTPRSNANAVIENEDEVLARCRLLIDKQQLLSENNQNIALQVDTLCVHGDNPQAVALVKQLRALIDDMYK